MESNNINRYTVTAALPYANGPVHIGHLAGCYIPADIYVRYLRLKGEDVLFVCGSDEHGIPITIKAKNEGLSPREVVDKYHVIMKNAFDAFGIDFDIYSRTSAEIHKETASAFFLDLYKKGELIEKETEEFYDPEAGEFLADRYIVGTCPSCYNPDAYGDQCEKCGKSLSPDELINPRSKLSGAVPVKRKTLHWYIDLGKHQDEWLRQWIESKKGVWKPNVMGQCLSWMGEGENKLKPRAVTRDLKWGVPVPAEIPGHEGKVLYVWFDAPIGYISATKEFFNKKGNQKPQWVKGNTWEDYWAEGKTKLIHFIGKDNIVFHCIIFPSMLKAFGNFTLPANVPANEFLNLEGEKISTSRNWAVWLHEYLQEMPGRVDELRYVLTANMPETKDNDFIWKYDGTENTTDSFQARVNNELVNNLGNFVNRVMVLIHKFNDGKIPVSNPQYVTPEEEELYSFCETQIDLIASKIEHFEFRAALSEIMKLSSAGNKFLQVAEPWKTYRQNPQAALQSLLVGVRLTNVLAILTAPFLPNTAKKLADSLNLRELSWSSLKDKSYMNISGFLNPLELLFKKVEENEISVQLEKLETKRKQGLTVKEHPEKESISAFRPEIQLDDFSKIDIRIGTIIHAEKVPKADKLLKLSVNTGMDTRTILSGIAGHFTSEELIGRQVAVLVNLAPRKMRGIESQGMILMAEDADGKLVFIKPETVVNPGARVR